MAPEFRDASESDIPQMFDLCADVWDYTKLFGVKSKDIAFTAAKQLVLHYISYSTHVRVAVLDGVLVGVGMVRVKDAPFFGMHGIYMWEEATCNRILLDDEDGKRAVEYRKGMFANCRKLTERHIGELDSELTLLLVSPECRGMGVGKRLLSDCIEKIGSGSRNIFLYTNGFCDRGFYDAIGFRELDKLSEKLAGVKLDGFLYIRDIPADVRL